MYRHGIVVVWFAREGTWLSDCSLVTVEALLIRWFSVYPSISSNENALNSNYLFVYFV